MRKRARERQRGREKENERKRVRERKKEREIERERGCHHPPLIFTPRWWVEVKVAAVSCHRIYS